MKKQQLKRLAYRPADAAAVCGVSERTFSDWLKSDNPPPHFRRVGVILVPRRELERWLSRQIKNSRLASSQESV